MNFNKTYNMRETNFKKYILLTGYDIPYFLDKERGDELRFKLPGITVMTGPNAAGMDSFIRVVGDYCIDNATRENRYNFVDVAPENLNEGMMDLLDEIHKEQYLDKVSLSDRNNFVKENDLFYLYNLYAKVRDTVTNYKHDGAIFRFFMKKMELKMINKDEDLFVLHYPEYRLHPTLQVALGEFLVRLNRSLGFKFVVLTHSHFIVDAIQQYMINIEKRMYDLPLAYYKFVPKKESYNDTKLWDDTNSRYHFDIKEVTEDDLESIYNGFAAAVDVLNRLRLRNEEEENKRNEFAKQERERLNKGGN